MSVWEQRANQLRKRRQMASREELVGSAAEDTAETPAVPQEAAPAHLPGSPASTGMPLPEDATSVAIAIPEPPAAEPLVNLSEEKTGGPNHRAAGGGGGRHRMARKFRPGQGPDEGARHRRHRHRDARSEAKSLDCGQAPHEEPHARRSRSQERKTLDEGEEKDEGAGGGSVPDDGATCIVNPYAEDGEDARR